MTKHDVCHFLLYRFHLILFEISDINKHDTKKKNSKNMLINDSYSFTIIFNKSGK